MHGLAIPIVLGSVKAELGFARCLAYNDFIFRCVGCVGHSLKNCSRCFIKLGGDKVCGVIRVFVGRNRIYDLVSALGVLDYIQAHISLLFIFRSITTRLFRAFVVLPARAEQTDYTKQRHKANKYFFHFYLFSSRISAYTVITVKRSFP